MQTKKFQRRIEDFECEHCNYKVKGSGYTNHCPKCLYSKHVDVNPGDRLGSCGGLMKPISTESTPKSFNIIHKCTICGYASKIRTDDRDNTDLIIELSSVAARSFMRSGVPLPKAPIISRGKERPKKHINEIFN